MKANTIATIIVSVPLMLSFHLKYGWLPAGLIYYFVFFWIVVSVYLVPVLLATEIILALRIYFSKTAERSLLKWSIWGMSIGLFAKIISIAARFSPLPGG